MGISLEKIAAPVALIFSGSIMFILGVILLATGVFPLINPPPTITEPLTVYISIAVGLIMVIVGVFLVWRETVATKIKHESPSPTEISSLARNLANDIRKELRDQVAHLPGATPLFEERWVHFKEEKEHLADHFLPVLLRRCQTFAQSGRRVFLLIDSGTTLFPFFERVGLATVRAFYNQETWLENLFVETNNLPGMIKLMHIGQVNPHHRYSPLAVHCDLLPGTPLPVYSALTGKKTNIALKWLRNEMGTDAIFIALTTGNWIRIRRSAPNCPIPLARGEGHLEFKQALIDYSDEIYVIAPLGKVLKNVPPGELNRELAFNSEQNDPDLHPYNEVPINDNKAKLVKLVSTTRTPGRLLAEHSTRIETLLGVDEYQLEDILSTFDKAEIEALPHIMFPFDKFPDELSKQLEMEFPHKYTRNEPFMRKFFSVSSIPTHRKINNAH